MPTPPPLWSTIPAKLVAVAKAQHGCFRRAQVLAYGCSVDEARRHAESGDWYRVRRGVYVEYRWWIEATPRLRAFIRAHAVALNTETRPVFSHRTAAELLGIELWDWGSDDSIHVTRPDASGRREGGVWHHEASLEPTEIVEIEGLLVTTPVRTALDLARWAPDDVRGVVAVDSALRVCGSYADRRRALDELERSHQQCQDWFGSRVARRAIALADPRSGSVGETRLRLIIAEPEMELLSQVTIREPSGRLVGIADFGLPECGVLVEFDGRIKYGLDGLGPEAVSKRQWAEKLRGDALDALGWVVVRVVWADLDDPRLVRRKLDDARDRALRRGPPRGTYSVDD